MNDLNGNDVIPLRSMALCHDMVTCRSSFLATPFSSQLLHDSLRCSVGVLRIKQSTSIWNHLEFYKASNLCLWRYDQSRFATRAQEWSIESIVFCCFVLFYLQKKRTALYLSLPIKLWESKICCKVQISVGKSCSPRGKKEWKGHQGASHNITYMFINPPHPHNTSFYKNLFVVPPTARFWTMVHQPHPWNPSTMPLELSWETHTRGFTQASKRSVRFLAQHFSPFKPTGRWMSLARQRALPNLWKQYEMESQLNIYIYTYRKSKNISYIHTILLNIYIWSFFSKYTANIYSNIVYVYLVCCCVLYFRVVHCYSNSDLFQHVAIFHFTNKSNILCATAFGQRNSISNTPVILGFNTSHADSKLDSLGKLPTLGPCVFCGPKTWRKLSCNNAP